MTFDAIMSWIRAVLASMSDARGGGEGADSANLRSAVHGNCRWTACLPAYCEGQSSQLAKRRAQSESARSLAAVTLALGPVADAVSHNIKLWTALAELTKVDAAEAKFLKEASDPTLHREETRRFTKVSAKIWQQTREGCRSGCAGACLEDEMGGRGDTSSLGVVFAST